MFAPGLRVIPQVSQPLFVLRTVFYKIPLGSASFPVVLCDFGCDIARIGPGTRLRLDIEKAFISLKVEPLPWGLNR